MVSVVLIIYLFIGNKNPDSLISKKFRKMMNKEDKKVMANNLKYIMGSFIIVLEFFFLYDYGFIINPTIVTAFTLIYCILVLIFVLPKAKENRKLINKYK